MRNNCLTTIILVVVCLSFPSGIRASPGLEARRFKPGFSSPPIYRDETKQDTNPLYVTGSFLPITYNLPYKNFGQYDINLVQSKTTAKQLLFGRLTYQGYVALGWTIKPEADLSRGRAFYLEVISRYGVVAFNSTDFDLTHDSNGAIPTSKDYHQSTGSDYQSTGSDYQSTGAIPFPFPPHSTTTTPPPPHRTRTAVSGKASKTGRPSTSQPNAPPKTTNHRTGTSNHKSVSATTSTTTDVSGNNPPTTKVVTTTPPSKPTGKGNPPASPSPTNHPISLNIVVGISVGIVVFVILLVLFGFFIWWFKFRKQSPKNKAKKGQRHKKWPGVNDQDLGPTAYMPELAASPNTPNPNLTKSPHEMHCARSPVELQAPFRARSLAELPGSEAIPRYYRNNRVRHTSRLTCESGGWI